MIKKALFISLIFITCCLTIALPVSAVDTTPPTVESTDPANGVTGVSTSTEISVKFSEPAGFSEFDSTMSITIKAGSESKYFNYYWNNGDTLTFGSSEPSWLEASTTYTVTISGIKDQAGNPMSSPYSWSFTTGLPDTTPPTVVSTDPADKDLNVPITLEAITITFNEPIIWDTTPVPGYGSMSAHLTEFDWTEVPLGTISASGNTLTISAPAAPSPWLEKWDWDSDLDTPGQQITGIYRLIVNGVRDRAGNPMANDVDVGFKTVAVDTTPPEVQSTSPADDATGVMPDAAITATMSEDINRCIGTATIVDNLGNIVPLKAGQGWDATDYKTVEVYPNAPLTIGRTYTVTFEGMVDNYMNEIAPYSWSFTVKTPAETTQDLSAKVDSLGFIPTVEKGLMDKLAYAQTLITQKKYTPARNTLFAFINQVNGQRGKGSMTPAVADDLIATAQRIISSIPGK